MKKLSRIWQQIPGWLRGAILMRYVLVLGAWGILGGLGFLTVGDCLHCIDVETVL